MFFTRLTIPLIGLLLIAAGIWISVLALTAPVPVTPDALPDHDYIPEIRKLMAEKKFSEAKILAEDADTPEARQLLEICDAELKSVQKRVLRSIKAFISGNPGCSVEEAGAALVSDMLMYGDIRDLVQQGYYKVSGKETDPLIAALAAAGLLTEFVDAADWLPALTKALRRMGAITDKFAGVLVTQLKKSAKAGKLTPEAKNVFSGMKTLYDKGGFLRTRAVIAAARNSDDIAHAAKLMEKAPGATHLIARSAGEKAPEVMEKLVKENASASYLKRLARKGPAGITLFWRGAKSIQKGNPQAFIRQLALLWGAKIHLLSLALVLAGLILNLKTVKLLSKRRRAHG